VNAYIDAMLGVAALVALGAAMLGPAVPFILALAPVPIVLAVAWLERGGAVGRLLRTLTVRPPRARWYLALTIPALGSIATVVVAAAAGLPVANTLDRTLPALLFLPLVVLIPAFAEELAWRGYALPRLLERYGAPRASLLLGALLTLFHVPLFLMKGGHPASYPFPLFAVMVLTLTVFFTWLAQHTGGSVLLAHLFHQSFNGWAEAIPFFPAVTGSLAPVLVALGALGAGAVLIVRQWLTASGDGGWPPRREATAPSA
jgi:membrane protease YdiL (CAAX protease family)